MRRPDWFEGIAGLFITVMACLIFVAVVWTVFPP